ncbi:MAG: glyoxalase [Bacteroidota bacterium]|nr:glyoxalase [Bacteroidota bacterium]
MLIKELRLQSTNILSLFSFYRDVLEMPAFRSGKGITITAGETKLFFEEATAGGNPFYHFAFNIPSNRFEEAYKWAKQKVDLLWLDDYDGDIADFVNWHAKSFYFKDPAGNILEMIARFDLNDTAEEDFSSMQIRNVSEIGIVFSVETFDNDVNGLMKEFSLNYFDKQPPLQHFRAIGNDEGLFIVVPENRLWFATKNQAKICHTEIAFINNNKLHKFILP